MCDLILGCYMLLHPQVEKLTEEMRAKSCTQIFGMEDDWAPSKFSAENGRWQNGKQSCWLVDIYGMEDNCWLVVSNIFYFPFHTWDKSFPIIDELIIFEDG